jgi:hypothetical protein
MPKKSPGLSVGRVSERVVKMFRFTHIQPMSSLALLLERDVRESG